jgi:hypothetical protein
VVGDDCVAFKRADAVKDVKQRRTRNRSASSPAWPARPRPPLLFTECDYIQLCATVPRTGPLTQLVEGSRSRRAMVGQDLLRFVLFLYMIRCPHSLQRMGSRGLMSFLAPQSSLRLGYNNARDIWCFSPAHKYSISCLGGGKKGAFVAELGCPCWFIVVVYKTRCVTLVTRPAFASHHRDGRYDQATASMCSARAESNRSPDGLDRIYLSPSSSQHPLWSWRQPPLSRIHHRHHAPVLIVALHNNVPTTSTPSPWFPHAERIVLLGRTHRALGGVLPKVPRTKQKVRPAGKSAHGTGTAVSLPTMMVNEADWPQLSNYCCLGCMRTEALQLPAQPAMLRMYPDNWPPLPPTRF